MATSKQKEPCIEVRLTDGGMAHWSKIEEALKHAKRVIVGTGAGISTVCGIPDFRSNTGVYGSKLSSKSRTGLDNIDFKQALDASLTRQNPEEYYKAIGYYKKLVWHVHETNRPSELHKLLGLLNEREQLLRVYTQNIDNIEALVGLETDICASRPTVIQMHGNLELLQCDMCKSVTEWTARLNAELCKGVSPQCKECIKAQLDRVEVQKKRSAGRIGRLKADIVLYNEKIDDSTRQDKIKKARDEDLRAKPDMLLILGTSMSIYDYVRTMRTFSCYVQSHGGIVVFVNTTELSKRNMDLFDYWLPMECDAFVAALQQRDPATWKFQERKAVVEGLPVAASRSGHDIRSDRILSTTSSRAKRIDRPRQDSDDAPNNSVNSPKSTEPSIMDSDDEETMEYSTFLRKLREINRSVPIEELYSTEQTAKFERLDKETVWRTWNR